MADVDDDEDAPVEGPPRRYGRRLVVAGLVVVVLVGGVWWAGSKVESPAQRAAQAAPPAASLVTAAVEERVLSESVVTRGDVRPSGASSITWTGTSGVTDTGGGGGAVVTGVPVVVGASVADGSVVVEVSGRPVIVVAGGVPVYRDLRPGMTGKDVAQFQAVLARLGFSPETDGVFGPATKTAVGAWYRALGYEPAMTAADAAVQLATAAKEVTAARQALETAQAVLAKAGGDKPRSARLQAQAAVDAAERQLEQAQAEGNQNNAQAAAALIEARDALARLVADPTSGADAIAGAKAKLAEAELAIGRVGAAGAAAVAAARDQVAIAKAARDEAFAPPDTAEVERAVVNATEALTAAQAAYEALDRASGVMVPAGELVVVPKLPARVDTVTATVGVKAEGVLAALSTDAVVVESTLTPAMKALVTVGAPVKIDDELSGAVYTGKITAVADQQVVPKEGQSGAAGFPARIETDTRIDPKLLGVNVRVTITAASTGTAQLVVPLAAVFAQADGTSRVSRVVDGREEPVTVTTGLAAGGFVAITTSTPALRAGDLVVVGT